MLSVKDVAFQCNQAYKKFLQQGTTLIKNKILMDIAAGIDAQRDFLQKENQKDIENGKKNNLSSAMLDRLLLNEKRIAGMIQSCEEVAALTDPVGRIDQMVVRPEGFKVGKMRTPIGVIGIIYEARPNVTIEAAVLCLKSGNGVILRGGSSAFYSNMALVKIIQDALKKNNVDPALISFIETTDRSSVDELVVQDETVHLIIPRGGESLIRSVSAKSRIPVLKHYKGVCHMYLSDQCDHEMAEKLAQNAKIQRPGVCNALETLLIDAKLDAGFVVQLMKKFQQQGVEIHGCDKLMKIYSDQIIAATEDDWNAEYLNLTLAVKMVDHIEEAVDHINQYSSGHTEAIISQDIEQTEFFVKNVDSSSVIVNASTRLADGGVYGLGAEIGIATDRLHARGPMGIEELTSYKWVVYGQGNARE